MKKFIFFFLLIPFFVKAQTTITPSFKTTGNINALDSLGAQWPGQLGGLHWYPTMSFLRTYVSAHGGGANIYNSDGVFTGDRHIDLSGHLLTFYDSNQGNGGTFFTLNISKRNVGFGYVTPLGQPFAGRSTELQIDTTGFLIKDSRKNKGLISDSYFGRNGLSGNQYAQIRLLDSTAKAKADSVVSAHSGGTNIYNSNGTLTSNRTLTLSTFSLGFSGGSNNFLMTNSGTSLNYINNQFTVSGGGIVTDVGDASTGLKHTKISVTTKGIFVTDSLSNRAILGTSYYGRNSLNGNQYVQLRLLDSTAKAKADSIKTTIVTGTTTNSLTFNNSGTGDASGTVFNGSSARTLSYNSIGAQVAGTYLTPTSTNTVTNKDLTSGTNTFPTFNQNTTGSAAKWTTGRTLSITGDFTYTSPPFDGSGNVTAAGTLATVNSNVGTFTYPSVTVNSKGLVTAISNGIAPTSANTPYRRQTATHCLIPTDKYAPATGQWTMARSMHYARETIVNPKIVFPNFYVNQSNVETVVGNGTIKASIEYPAGTFTLSNENIANSNNPITQSGALAVLTFNVTIPNGAQFWVRTLQINNNGPVYQNYQNVYNQPTSEGFESGTGTVGDKTTSGTIAFGGRFAYMPILITSMTTRPSVLIVGDSRQAGGQDALDNVYGDIGELPRAVGPWCGYTNFAIAGSLLAGYNSATRTVRDQIINGTITGLSSGVPYFKYIVNAYGVNDFGSGGDSPATLAGRRTTFAGLYSSSGIVIGGTTLAPYNQSSDSWATSANQSLGTNEPKILVFNTLERTGISGEAFSLDVNKAIDPYSIGQWPVSPNINNSIPYNVWSSTAAISGTTMTVSAVASGTIKLYDYITGPNLQPGTQITALGTGTGGTGTYTVNLSQTAASNTVFTGAYASIDGLHETTFMYRTVAEYLKPFIPYYLK